MLHHRRPGAERESTPNSPPAPAIAAAAVAHPDPRRRLFDAMIETVASRGYDRTTVGRVCASAGLQEAVFSEHFHDKRDCFLRAVEDLIVHTERTALECLSRDAPWWERVRAAIDGLLRALAENPLAARVVLVEMLAAGPEACERHRSMLALFTSLMEEGRGDCASPECLPEQTSEAIVGGVTSILHRRVLQGDTARLPALRADLTYFALLPYLDHEHALAASRDTR
jgi:AcrR family transcriptional regulator